MNLLNKTLMISILCLNLLKNINISPLKINKLRLRSKIKIKLKMRKMIRILQQMEVIVSSTWEKEILAKPNKYLKIKIIRIIIIRTIIKHHSRIIWLVMLISITKIIKNKIMISKYLSRVWKILIFY
jgi:hypothetical protein